MSEKYTQELEENDNQAIILTKESYDEIERLDFNDPSSMLRLGSKLLEEAKNLVTNESLMNKNFDDESLVDINEQLKSVGDFRTKLDSIEDKSKNQEKKKLLLPIAGKLFKRINEVLNNDENLSYSEILEKYNQNIEAITMHLSEQNSKILQSIAQSKEYISKLEPIVAKLKRTIEIGREDIKNYQETVIKPLEESYKTNSSDISKLNYAKQIKSLFENRLNSLESSQLTLEANIGQQRQKQGPNMELVMLATDWMSTVAPVLMNSGVNIIDTRIQTKRLEEYNAIVTSSNNILKENSKNIVDNIEKTTELKLAGNIHLETLKEFADNLSKGTKLLKDGVKLMEEQSHKNEAEHKQIQRSLELSREELENFYQTDMISLPELVESSQTASQNNSKYYQPSKEEKGYARVKKIFRGK